jgi:hypothetical protein
MNTETKKQVDVPSDVMVDIARIILQNKLPHKITEVDIEYNAVVLEIIFPSERSPIEIEMFSIIDDYNGYRYEE